MVTILETKETVPVESARVPDALQPRPAETGRQAREWRYSMPFAGVRYFSFGPDPRPTAQETNGQALRAELIDERVILL